MLAEVALKINMMTHYLFECEKTKLRAIAVVKSMAWHMIRDEAKLRGLEPPTYQDIVELKKVPNPHKKRT